MNETVNEDEWDKQSGQSLFFLWYDFMVAFLAIIINTFALIAISKCKFRLYGYRTFLISLTSGDLYIVRYFTLFYFYFIFVIHFILNGSSLESIFSSCFIKTCLPIKTQHFYKT